MGWFNSPILINSLAKTIRENSTQHPSTPHSPPAATEGSTTSSAYSPLRDSPFFGPVVNELLSHRNSNRAPPQQQSSEGFFGPVINELRRQEGIGGLPVGEEVSRSMSSIPGVLSKQQILVQAQATGQRPQIVAQYAGWPPERILAEFGA